MGGAVLPFGEVEEVVDARKWLGRAGGEADLEAGGDARPLPPAGELGEPTRGAAPGDVTRRGLTGDPSLLVDPGSPFLD